MNVLHKRTGQSSDDPLAVGKTFKFPGSGTAYTVLESGAVVRANPKPDRNKAERKSFLRERRLAREMAA